MQTVHYPARDNFLSELLAEHGSQLGVVWQRPEKYRLQIIYTRIDRDSRNRPHFTDYHYHVDSAYFYPASTVKLPGAVLALEKLRDLGIPGLDRHTPLRIDSLPGLTPAVLTDSSAPGGHPTIGHYIKKIFLVSDNDAYNRLYEFVGQRALNERLWELGYTQTQLRHRVAIFFSPEANRHTNPFTFYQEGGELYRQPAQYSEVVFPGRRDSVGRGYTDAQGHFIEGPMDFSMKNRLPLTDLHDLLRRIIFPEAVTKAQRLRLTENDYQFLYHCMSQLPSESSSPIYDTTEFHDGYVKFLLRGGERHTDLPAGIRIFNKPGWAYGFLTDAAYVTDIDHGVEFMLSATVYVNEADTFGEDKYEFDEIGKPFMKMLGRIIYNYELQRRRPYQPDLSRFKMVTTDNQQ
ncbi:class A beta-lactamase-related serine hydrolase [Chitinophaga pendula]|uniref:serine hydrolase n=1 Tax=Chitinophaga TaxID=79328 RepID=UPI000BAEE96B|nr:MULTISPECIES: serine hydrolase [Chitinophaga]ASZ15107.1 hypothetical protein CK934_25195 [Chitinophaga sp. MD30]UCJ08360.1 class A beta-lactamase-related serine hydrolase [Chitinophaga pendula]